MKRKLIFILFPACLLFFTQGCGILSSRFILDAPFSKRVFVDLSEPPKAFWRNSDIIEVSYNYTNFLLLNARREIWRHINGCCVAWCRRRARRSWDEVVWGFLCRKTLQNRLPDMSNHSRPFTDFDLPQAKNHSHKDTSLTCPSDYCWWGKIFEAECKLSLFWGWSIIYCR